MGVGVHQFSSTADADFYPAEVEGRRTWGSTLMIRRLYKCTPVRRLWKLLHCFKAYSEMPKTATPGSWYVLCEFIPHACFAPLSVGVINVSLTVQQRRSLSHSFVSEHMLEDNDYTKTLGLWFQNIYTDHLEARECMSTRAQRRANHVIHFHRSNYNSLNLR